MITDLLMRWMTGHDVLLWAGARRILGDGAASAVTRWTANRSEKARRELGTTAWRTLGCGMATDRLPNAHSAAAMSASVLGDALSEASNVMRSTSGSHQLLCRH